ncbi:hypothetical protein C4D60_Mb09t03600 [Musa balbisiana]|uniref:Uncharacterized protein n=1 Tax=Musa balbisiana TaxID=52838 RepID=A0A4S8IDS9_MUSBA|nr:hypothetical protein C4D60_Mb09t03600 [Musa balbisiana]
MEYENRCRQSQRGKYDCLLFDLDDTLYPLSSGIAIQCRNNIGDYLVEKLGIEENKVSALCNLLYKNYGTTMAGLKAIGYDFDYDDYHSFVHGRLPHENLKPDPVLRQLLLSLPIRKVVSSSSVLQKLSPSLCLSNSWIFLAAIQVFTNADKVHAAKVLKKLRLEDCFEGIICFETLNPPSSSSVTETSSQIFDIVEHFARPDTGGIELPKTPILCKPSLEAMEYALRIANIDPQRTVFFDDSVRNVQSGKRIGLHTVLVGTAHKVKGADYALESIHNIREALPGLWEEAEKSDGIRYSGKVAMETSVTA